MTNDNRALGVAMQGLRKTERARISLRAGHCFSKGPYRLLDTESSCFLVPEVRLWQLTEWDGPRQSYVLYSEEPRNRGEPYWVARFATWDFARTKISAIRDGVIHFDQFSRKLYRLPLSRVVRSQVRGLLSNLSQVPVSDNGSDVSQLRELAGFALWTELSSFEVEWVKGATALDDTFVDLWQTIDGEVDRSEQVHNWIEDYSDLDQEMQDLLQKLIQ